MRLVVGLAALLLAGTVEAQPRLDRAQMAFEFCLRGSYRYHRLSKEPRPAAEAAFQSCQSEAAALGAGRPDEKEYWIEKLTGQ